MNARLEERAREVRKRWLIRAWEYRRREGSGGVWARLARVLAGVREVYVIDADDAATVEALGVCPQPVGLELHPQKRLFLVDEGALAALKSARRINVRLSAELLAARRLALLPFDG